MSKRLVALAFTVVAAALVLAACGGGGSSSSSSTSGSTSEETTSSSGGGGGEPVKLMALGAIEAPGFSLPSIPVGAEVAVEEINAEGGINGHPVELIVCNEENNPNTAIQCARQAVKEEVAAVVGGLSIFDVKLDPVLEEAGIPWIGPSTGTAFTQKNIWLIGGDGASVFASMGTALVEGGCKNVGVVISVSALETNTAQVEAGVISAGGKVASTGQAPKNSADWAPVVAAARSAGAECIATATGPAETGPLLAAINSGAKLPVAASIGGLPEVVLKELGPSSNGVLVSSGFLPASSPEGIVKELGEKIEAKAEVPYEQFAQTGYISVQLVKEAVKGGSEVTAQTVTEGLPSITNYNTELGPVIDFSEPSSIKGFERVFNPDILMLEAKNGELVTTGPPIDMTSALEYLSEHP